MSKHDDYERITLRIPKDVHRELTELAAANSSSMNAEIIMRLRRTLSNQDGFTSQDRAILKKISALLKEQRVRDDRLSVDAVN